MESEEPWSEYKCRFYGCEVLLALEFMHQNNIVYRFVLIHFSNILFIKEEQKLGVNKFA